MAARRAGVAASTAELLAFTDSDCLPVPGWMAAGVAALDEGADLVHGPTRPLRPAGPLERTTSSAKEGLYPSCNVFYRRSAYDSAGGFDPLAAQRFRIGARRRARGLGFGEDTLLAWTVARNAEVRYVEDAVVHHHVFRPDLAETVSRAAMMVAFPALVREVPELRNTPLLRGGIEIGPRSRVPLHVLVVSLIARRRGLARLSATWWVGLRALELARKPGPISRHLAALPAELAVDVITAGALVAGSARTRTLVL